MEFLNKEGVQILWSKVKDKVQSINKEFVGLNNVTNDAQVKRSEMGAANGVPTLDSNGKIPVDQLGNLDTVVAMVVTELPTTDIKTNKIYLVKDSTTEGDLYQEYLYIDGKWEKVGTHKQEVDLTDYVRKEDAVTEVAAGHSNGKSQISYFVNGQENVIDLMKATTEFDGVMSAADKQKLDGLSNYTLPIASATALGGIKLGSGLSVTNDGTVSVSADVVAGAVQWNSIENKPNVAILGNGDADGTNANSGRILFQTEQNNDGYVLIGHDGESYSINITQDGVNDSSTIYIQPSAISVSSTEKIGNVFNKVEIGANGITLSNREGVPSNCVFMTDGTIQELIAITPYELNEILV